MENSTIWLIVLGVVCVANLNLFVFTNWQWNASKSDFQSDIDQLLTESEEQANQIAALQESINELKRLFTYNNLLTTDKPFDSVKGIHFSLIGYVDYSSYVSVGSFH